MPSSQPLLLGPVLEETCSLALFADPCVLGGGNGELLGNLLLVDFDGPVEVLLAIPLAALGLLVQLVERWPLALRVIPGEQRVVARLHDRELRRHVTVGERHDRFDVVNVALHSLTIREIDVRVKCHGKFLCV